MLPHPPPMLSSRASSPGAATSWKSPGWVNRSGAIAYRLHKRRLELRAAKRRQLQPLPHLPMTLTGSPLTSLPSCVGPRFRFHQRLHAGRIPVYEEENAGQQQDPGRQIHQ